MVLTKEKIQKFKNISPSILQYKVPCYIFAFEKAITLKFIVGLAQTAGPFYLTL